jgi:hypothetical protein
MAAAYSMDLRSRVLKDADAGLSSKELAERYHVGRAWGGCRDRDRFPRPMGLVRFSLVCGSK